ncbi:MAG: outer membrane protein assembly factor BamD [Candidatus Latescibacterota bacterium]
MPQHATSHPRRLRSGLPLALLVTLGGCAGSGGPALQGAEAHMQNGLKALKDDDCAKATEEFQRLVSNYPGSSLAPDAQYYLAESYFCAEDYVNSVFEYQRLLDTYPSSQWLDEAQFQIGESYYQQTRQAPLDQKETYQALEQFRLFLDEFAGSPLADKARQRIQEMRSRLAKKIYLSAELYHRQDHLDAAALTYQEVLSGYPDTPWFYRAQLRLGEIARARGQLEEATRRWTEVARDSQDAKVRAEAQKHLQEIGAASGG